MKIHLTLLMLFILSLSVPTVGQSAKIEGSVSDDKGAPVAGIRIGVTPGGYVGTTDSQGHFTIRLPDDVQPRQAVQLIIDRNGWVISTPMFGVCVTQSVGRNDEPLAVMIVPRSSPLTLSPRGLSAVIAKWAAERVKMDFESSMPRQELGEYMLLREYATWYGVTLDEFRNAAEKWAQIKESDDKEEQALKEYWRQNYGKAAQLAEEAAQAASEELKQSQQRTAIASLIRRYMLAGNAFYADNKLNEALTAYGRIEELFETGRISKEDFTEEWAEVKLLMADMKVELGGRVEGAAGPRLLAEALAAYRQAETFYTRAQMPRQWAIAQNSMGAVLRELSNRTDGGESTKYLNEAADLFRTTLEVLTRTQTPQQWAMAQNNLGVVLSELGGRVEGSESAKYLNESVAAYRAALEIHTRAQMPQQWAMTQKNLDLVLRALATLTKGKGVR
jgi:tetratricopeptide (TPR) repeat protein